MQDQQPRRLLSPLAIASFSAILIATGSGVAWWTWKTYSVPSSTSPTPEYPQAQVQGGSNSVGDPSKSQKLPPTTTPATAEQTLQVYWLKTSGNSIKLAPVSIELTATKTATNSPEALLESAIQQLLAGPSQANLSTTIPTGTQLLDLTMKADGIHINLSREFTTGGGSTSMEGRLAQVLYTATSLNPSMPVWLSIKGEPLEVLGGEGLVVEQPITRKQFETDFPVF